MEVVLLEKLRKLTDLFVCGDVVAIPDAPLIFVRVLNTFERQECLSAGQTARARLVMALKGDSDERERIAGRVLERGREAVVSEIAEARTEARSPEITNDIASDKDWAERIDIVINSDPDDSARPLEKSELDLIERINREFFEEVERRKKDEL